MSLEHDLALVLICLAIPGCIYWISDAVRWLRRRAKAPTIYPRS